MSTDLALPSAANEHADRFKKALSKFRTFVPSHINTAQLFAALTYEINGLPDNCTKGSVTVAIVNTCVIGLIPGPALGHCHFVPFTFNKGKDSEYTVAQLIVGYKGFLELAFANNFLIDVNPEVVLQGEECNRWHDINGPQIKHLLPDVRPEVDRKTLVGAYCTWHTRSGGRGYYWRSKAEIDKVDRGEKSNTPWRSDYRAMVLKSAIRPAAKLWRLTKSMADAVMIDEQAERGENQAPLAAPPEEDYDTAQDARANLVALLKHKVGCKSQNDQEAVLRYFTGVSFEEATPEQLMTAIGHIMTWEKETGETLSELLSKAKDF